MSKPTLALLSVEDCWRLVPDAGVGRIAVSRDREAPIVVPVNYVVDDRTIVFRTGAGTKLSLLHDRPISFQVDDFDPLHRTGWSVLIRGVAVVDERVCDPDAAPVPWSGGVGRRTVVRLWPSSVSGRRLEAPEHEWDPRGYL